MRSVFARLTLVTGVAAVDAEAQQHPNDSATALAGVTVTATRNPASVLTLPLAVSKLTASELRSVNGFGLDEALARVPGVIAQSRYGTGDIRLMIRGFGARGAGDRSNSGTSRGVRVLLDGFPETEPDGRTALDQLDLATAEAVEVIRSNASSAYGNAAGGVVNVITVPTSRTPAAELQPVVGGFGLLRYAARTSAPLGSSGVAFGNFTNTSFDGWREHSSARRALVNGGAVGLVGDRTRLGLYATAANNLMHVPGPLTKAQVDGDPRQANATYLARDERRYNRTGRLGVTVDHALGDASSIASMAYVNPKYLQRSERNTYRDFTRYHFGGNIIGRTAFTTGDVKSRVTVGADGAYQDGAILFYNLTNGGRGTTLMDNKGEGASNVGIFVQDEIAASDRLTLLVGARWDHVAYNYRSFLPTPPVRADRRDFGRVSPKLGVSWQVGKTHAIYANVGGGIEVPAGNETDPTPGAPPALLNPLLDPIVSTSYEVGLKSVPTSVGAGAVTLGYDAALYDIEVRNDAIPYNAGRFYLTAGRGRRQGAEVGLSADTRSGVFANAAMTFSRNRYLEYVVDSATIFPTDPTKAGKRADYSGNDVVGLASALMNVELGTAIPGARMLRVKGAVEHSSRYFADDANNVTVPAYTVFNVGVELTRALIAPNGIGMRGFVTVRNATNRKFIGSAFLNPDLVGNAPAAYEPGTPRTVVVSLSIGRLR